VVNVGNIVASRENIGVDSVGIIHYASDHNTETEEVTLVVVAGPSVEGRIDREIVVDLGVATWSKRFSEATSWVTCLASVKALSADGLDVSVEAAEPLLAVVRLALVSIQLISCTVREIFIFEVTTSILAFASHAKLLKFLGSFTDLDEATILVTLGACLGSSVGGALGVSHLVALPARISIWRGGRSGGCSGSSSSRVGEEISLVISWSGEVIGVHRCGNGDLNGWEGGSESELGEVEAGEVEVSKVGQLGADGGDKRCDFHLTLSD